ncbi:hypothetical protein C8F01DRAFT_1110611 [Mycena amicta]|nr:hypothetical protein C8F01DRAFT_1110611 [Mycena amicta]
MPTILRQTHPPSRRTPDVRRVAIVRPKAAFTRPTQINAPKESPRRSFLLVVISFITWLLGLFRSTAPDDTPEELEAPTVDEWKKRILIERRRKELDACRDRNVVVSFRGPPEDASSERVEVKMSVMLPTRNFLPIALRARKRLSSLSSQSDSSEDRSSTLSEDDSDIPLLYLERDL